MKKVYFAQEIPNHLAVCVFNNETEKVSYVPFNANVHVLENDVQSGLVADWQMVMNRIKSPNQSDATAASSEFDETKTFRPH